MFGHTTCTHQMPFHTTSMTLILMALGICVLYILSHFLVSPQYYFTSSGSMRLSFYGNLNDYYHEYHGIRNSFHDYVLVHVFGTISHSLQGIIWI